MLADILHKIAEMDNEDEQPYYPRPSMSGPDRCSRQMVYHGLKTQPKPFGGRFIHVLNDSSWHEELTDDWIRKSAFQLHSEQMRIVCRPPMTYGSIDGIITDMLGIDRLYEHKALNHFTFQRYWDGELPMDYLTQCAVYMDAIQTNDNPALHEGILLIKNKNTSQYLEYLLDYNQDVLTVLKSTLSTGESKEINFNVPNIVQAACDKLVMVQDHIDRRALPKRQYDIDDWHCEYCRYGETCWEGYEAEFNELATDAMLPNEVADMVRFYKETGAQKKEIDDQYEELATKIKTTLKDAGIREGKAGEYILKLKMQKTNRIDKTLLTLAEMQKATVQSFSERLYISKAKEM